MILKQILAILSVLAGVFLYGRSTGKKEIEQKENKNAVKQIQARNKAIDDTRKLSDSERSRIVQILTRDSSK